MKQGIHEESFTAKGPLWKSAGHTSAVSQPQPTKSSISVKQISSSICSQRVEIERELPSFQSSRPDSTAEAYRPLFHSIQNLPIAPKEILFTM